MIEPRHKGGRPSIEEGVTKPWILSIRFSVQERINIEAAAKANGKAPSVWAREVLHDHAKYVLGVGR